MLWLVRKPFWYASSLVDHVRTTAAERLDQLRGCGYTQSPQAEEETGLRETEEEEEEEVSSPEALPPPVHTMTREKESIPDISFEKDDNPFRSPRAPPRSKPRNNTSWRCYRTACIVVLIQGTTLVGIAAWLYYLSLPSPAWPAWMLQAAPPSGELESHLTEECRHGLAEMRASEAGGFMDRSCSGEDRMQCSISKSIPSRLFVLRYARAVCTPKVCQPEQMVQDFFKDGHCVSSATCTVYVACGGHEVVTLSGTTPSTSEGPSSLAD